MTPQAKAALQDYVILHGVEQLGGNAVTVRRMAFQLGLSVKQVQVCFNFLVVMLLVFNI